MILTLEVRMVYGRPLYYPACALSTQLLRLMDKKTFGLHHIEILRDAGFTVEYL